MRERERDTQTYNVYYVHASLEDVNKINIHGRAAGARANELIEPRIYTHVQVYDV